MDDSKKQLDISIVIVNYNSFNHLENCIKSILDFTHGCTYEIIVIDNASDEGNVENITIKYSQTLLLKNEKNIGFAAANNVGFKSAKGKYILILNNDTVLYENSLKKIFDFAESIEREVFIGCKLLNEDGTHQVSVVDFDNIINSFGENFLLYKLLPRSRLLNRFHLNFKLNDVITEVDIVKGAFIFCSSTAIRKLGGFDENFFFYGEETDLCQRFKAAGGKVFYFPMTSIYHIGGVSTDKNLWFKFRNQSLAKIQIYQKHYKGIKKFCLISFHFWGIIIRVPIYFLGGILLMRISLLKKSFYYLLTLFIYPQNKFEYS